MCEETVTFLLSYLQSLPSTHTSHYLFSRWKASTSSTCCFGDLYIACRKPEEQTEGIRSAKAPELRREGLGLNHLGRKKTKARRLPQDKEVFLLDYLFLPITLVATQHKTWGILVIHSVIGDILEGERIVLVI